MGLVTCCEIHAWQMLSLCHYDRTDPSVKLHREEQIVQETFRPDEHLMLHVGSLHACCLGYVNVEIEIILYLLSNHRL